jgi:hypothetical protein
VEVLSRTGAHALSLDVRVLGQDGWEALAPAVEKGAALWAGAVPTDRPARDARVVADAVAVPWRRIGLDVGLLAGVVITPTCGLASAGPLPARAALRSARDAAAVLAERELA